MEDSSGDGSVENNEELLKECTPRIGMDFESEPDAFRFYNEYGRILGFDIRRDYHNKSKPDGIMINRKFVCNKEGVKDAKRSSNAAQPIRETRSNCTAFMYIAFDRASLKWSVTRFDETHNHKLHDPETVHMMRTQRKVCESQAINAEIAEASGLSLKMSHDLISAQSGGKECVGFMREDLKSHLRSRRERDLQYGEAGILFKYFQKQTFDNPYFFHRIQLDVDEMITNIFWADLEMMDENDQKLVISARYRHLCPKMVTLAARASEDAEGYKLVHDTITLLCAQVDNLTLSKHGVGASSSGPNIDKGLDLIDPNLKKAKGFKKKVMKVKNAKGGKRLKPWHEKLKKKGLEQSGTEIVLQNPSSNQPTVDETAYYPQMAHLLSQASCSAPSVSEEIAFDRPINPSTHIPMEAEAFLYDDEFIDLFVNAQSPSQN